MAVRALSACVFACFLVSVPNASAQQRWLTLPPTPDLPRAVESGSVQSDGARIWYATFGRGPAVTLLHGGLANSNYWGLQIRYLSRKFRVIAIDSRGHGRSTNDGRAYSYIQMANDAVAVLDHLKIRQTAVVGWSDGAIIGLYLAINQPQRVRRLFAFAGNYNSSGLSDGSASPVFKAYLERTPREYRELSPGRTPEQYQAFLTAVMTMWGTQPNIQPAELQSIRVPVWIVDGDRDEAVKRSHTEELAGFIPDAGLLIQPQVSHFSFLQAPDQFSAALLHFLEEPGIPHR
ncbi:MAG: alpha/beta hydrolase [Xanthobacteraceae bacterium]